MNTYRIKALHPEDCFALCDCEGARVGDLVEAESPALEEPSPQTDPSDGWRSGPAYTPDGVRLFFYGVKLEAVVLS